MPSLRYLPILCVLLAVPPARAEIYKYYDADGNLVLSDAVPKERAEKVERVTPRDIMTVPALKPVPRKGAAATPPVVKPAKVAYAIVVVSPAEGGNYPRGPEPVPVAVSVAPALAEGHRLEFLLDGVASASLDAIPVQDMPAGDHALAIRTLDAKGVVLQSRTVNFQIR